MMAWAHAARLREATEDRHDAIEAAEDRLRGDFDALGTDDQHHWYDSVNEISEAELEGALFSAQTPQVAWAALENWRHKAREHYVDAMLRLEGV